MILSIDAKKAFENNSTSILNKNSLQTGYRGGPH